MSTTASADDADRSNVKPISPKYRDRRTLAMWMMLAAETSVTGVWKKHLISMVKRMTIGKKKLKRALDNRDWSPLTGEQLTDAVKSHIKCTTIYYSVMYVLGEFDWVEDTSTSKTDFPSCCTHQHPTTRDQYDLSLQEFKDRVLSHHWTAKMSVIGNKITMLDGSVLESLKTAVSMCTWLVKLTEATHDSARGDEFSSWIFQNGIELKVNPAMKIMGPVEDADLTPAQLFGMLVAWDHAPKLNAYGSSAAIGTANPRTLKSAISSIRLTRALRMSVSGSDHIVRITCENVEYTEHQKTVRYNPIACVVLGFRNEWVARSDQCKDFFAVEVFNPEVGLRRCGAAGAAAIEYIEPPVTNTRRRQLEVARLFRSSSPVDDDVVDVDIPPQEERGRERDDDEDDFVAPPSSRRRVESGAQSDSLMEDLFNFAFDSNGVEDDNILVEDSQPPLVDTSGSMLLGSSQIIPDSQPDPPVVRRTARGSSSTCNSTAPSCAQHAQISPPVPRAPALPPMPSRGYVDWDQLAMWL